MVLQLWNQQNIRKNEENQRKSWKFKENQGENQGVVLRELCHNASQVLCAFLRFPTVRRQATVSARPREDRAVSPAQKNTAVANIAHAEVIIACRESFAKLLQFRTGQTGLKKSRILRF